MQKIFRSLLLIGGVAISGCASFSARDASPVPLAPKVDLQRFSGPWYVIAQIPTPLDAGVADAIESYQLDAQGRILTTYTSRKGGLDGKQQTFNPTTEIMPDSGNALWAVRFAWYWPFWYEYRVAYLEPDYSVAIIARSKLDYVWLFSRKSKLSEAQLARYTKLIASWGYDVSKLERVPQK
jgi:apolipoprotein D and lipocalin family protein